MRTRTRTIRIINENDSQLQVFYLRKIKFSPKTYSKDQRYDPKYKFRPIRVAVVTHKAFQENANPALVM
jgi:hypothetical protein